MSGQLRHRVDERVGAQANAVAAVPPSAAAVSVWASVRAALPAWLLARAIVLGGLWYAAATHDGPLVAGPDSDVRALVVWDVVWYRRLGEEGYLAYGPLESRFFPLLPASVGVGQFLRLPTGPWMLAVCWVAALAFAAALHRLMLVESGDERAARRAAWLVQLVPGANALVLGYTEALAGFLAVAYFLALRTRSTIGIPVGILSGLARPTGPLLALAGAVELLRPGSRGRLGWSARAAVVAAPVLGTAVYLAWAWRAFGDPLTPYRVQAGSDLRRGVVSLSVEFLFRTSPGGYRWQLVLALLIAAVGMLYVCARRLPAAYTVWAAVGMAAAVTAYGLHSLPRYLAAIFPLAMAAAIVLHRRWLWWPALGLCVAGFAWVSYLNLTSTPVP